MQHFIYNSSTYPLLRDVNLLINIILAILYSQLTKTI